MSRTGTQLLMAADAKDKVYFWGPFAPSTVTCMFAHANPKIVIVSASVRRCRPSTRCYKNCRGMSRYVTVNRKYFRLL